MLGLINKTLVAISATGLLALSVGTAFAQYPERPVTIIVGYQAGSINDVSARLIADALSDSLGQPFIVENHPGATGTIADRMVANAAPDGYTLLVASSAITTNAALRSSYTDYQGLDPVTRLAISMNTFVAGPSAPFEDLGGLVEYARANPGGVLYATSGIGSSSHLVAEAFNIEHEIDMIHVPYPSVPERNLAVLAGEVELGVGTPLVNNEDIVQLGVLGRQRSAHLPDTPTFEEQGYPLETGADGSWIGFFVPQGTPSEIIDLFYPIIQEAVHSELGRERFFNFSFEAHTDASGEFAGIVEAQIEEWTTIAENLGLRE